MDPFFGAILRDLDLCLDDERPRVGWLLGQNGIDHAATLGHLCGVVVANADLDQQVGLSHLRCRIVRGNAHGFPGCRQGAVHVTLGGQVSREIHVGTRIIRA